MNSDLRTAVIVPMLMATLANGQNLLRITVLSSLRTTNAADWQWKCLSQHGALVSCIARQEKFHVDGSGPVPTQYRHYELLFLGAFQGFDMNF